MGIEPPTSSVQNTTFSLECGAESGALSIDSDLIRIVKAWQAFPDPVRAAIVAMVAGAERTSVERA